MVVVVVLSWFLILWKMLHIKGLSTRKPLGHDSRESLNFHWLRVSWTPVLGLHEDIFGQHPITFSMDDKFTWNPILQVWIMLARVVGNFFGTTLKDRLGRNAASLSG